MGEKKLIANPPMKIFVFCDGTGQNAVRNKEPTQDTNVHRFRQCVPESAFVKHIYQSGAGTHAPEGTSAISFASIADLGDKATGKDLHSIIQTLYKELCEKYEKNRDAEIHLIGFSRGAFAVRCLACLIDKIGLLKANYQTKYYPHVYDIWQSQDESRFNKWATGKGWYQSIYPVRIASCGVWDTVSTIIQSPALSFVSDWIPSNLNFAFQALALHERRELYNPLLWKHKPGGRTCIRQCWFAGDHSDNGGSWYDCGLANLTLIWMLAQYKKNFTGDFIDCDRLYERLCPPGAGWPSLSHTLSQGNVHRSWGRAKVWQGKQAREHLLGQDSGKDGNDSVPLYQQQRIHFTVRLFLAKGRQEVTERTSLVTAGSTKPTHPDDANQRSVAWVLEKTGKNERGKGGDKGQKKNEGKAKEKNERKADKNEGKAEKNDGKVKEKNKEKAEKKNDGNTAKKGERNTEKKGEDANEKKSEEKSEKKGEEKRKKNHEDILTIVEDETTEWENDIIFEWTKKAQKLVKKDVHNIFQEGVELHGMTVGHLVRGLKNAGNIPSLTVEQLRRKDKDLTVEKACKIIIDQAWECSLEHFLRENKNQGTCKAAKRVHYIPPKNVVVGFRKRSSSEGPTPTGTMVGSDERNEPRRRSFDPSRDVESFEDQTIHSEAP